MDQARLRENPAQGKSLEGKWGCHGGPARRYRCAKRLGEESQSWGG